MKRRIIPYLILAVSLMNFMGTGFARDSEPAFIDKKNPQRSTVHLFNGKDLSGWYAFLKGKGRNVDPNQVFTVQDKHIRISGEEFGCITTNEEYENYKLVVEFKWGGLTYAPRVDKARDSGIMLHSVGEDGAVSGIWMQSIECQVIEGGSGDLLVVGDGSPGFSITCTVEPEMQSGSHVFKPGGQPATIHGGRVNWYGRDPGWKDAKGFRGAKDIEKPLGKWNRMVCIAKGNKIDVYLNGKLVNQAYDVKPQKGRIQIQSEGAEIFFRRIDLITLPSE